MYCPSGTFDLRGVVTQIYIEFILTDTKINFVLGCYLRMSKELVVSRVDLEGELITIKYKIGPQSLLVGVLT